MVYGNSETLFVKPFFHLFIYLFYIAQAKKFNFLLFLFLFASMVGEMFVAMGFEDNYVYVMLLYAVVFCCGILLLRPTLNATKLTFNFKDVLVPILLTVGLVYVIISVYISAIDYLPQLLFYSLSLILFAIFVFTSFYIFFFNKHPKSVYIFITGAGYTVICMGTFLFELISPSQFLLGLVNLCEVITQFSFVMYVLNLKEISTKRKWYI